MRESVAPKHASPVATKNPPEDVACTFLRSVDDGTRFEQPYPHWILSACLPTETVEDILALPFPAPSLGGVSGKRELHNNTRKYFDVENRKIFPVCEIVAQAFQDKGVTDHIANTFGTRLGGTYLRIEFAQDTDGFWLDPHTDLGVKSFSMLLYISKDDSHRDLGTDIYDANKTLVSRSPFASNAAMIFVPSNNTYHGFEKRPIKGVRKSLIINYVTKEWRAREQLAFPDKPIA